MAPTVLVVDYDPRSISRLRTLLISAGCRPIIARDGRVGIEEFLRSEPELTLVQDLLPKQHGFDVCRKIKESKAGNHRPVVVLSNAHHGALLSTGCDAYIEKPFEDEELLEIVRHFLSDHRLLRSAG